MLPERLLDLDLDGDTVRPRYVTTRGHLWVQALLDRLAACEGQPRPEVERRLERGPRQGESWFAWRAMCALMLRRHGFEVRACARPLLLRQALFCQAGIADPGEPRHGVLASAAATLEVSPRELERDLYADIPAARVLRPLAEPAGVDEVIEAYNLALAQGLARRAEQLRVTMEGNVKAVLRFAHLRRLLCLAEQDPNGGPVRLSISGPLSLFHHTTKYGNAMAAWLPVLVRAPRWRLEATCLVRDRRRTWRASHADPIGTTHRPVKRFDSVLERRFFRDLSRQAPHWEVLREADPVQIGRRVLCPDFTLVDPARGLRIPVEVVGYWTPEYLRNKWEVLQSLPPDSPWLVCLDENLAGAAGETPAGVPFFRFKKRIDVARFLAFVERWIERRPVQYPTMAPKVKAMT